MKTLLALAALTLAPSHLPASKTDEPAPHEGLVTIVKSLRSNDLASAVRASVSAERFARMQAIWDTHRKAAADPAENAQLQSVMALLTAPGAEDTLLAMVEPKLAEMKPQMAMIGGMVAGMGAMQLQQNTELSDAERAQAQKLLEAVGQYLVTHDLTDPASARKAIGILCSTARKLGVRSLEDVQALTLEQLLAKGGVLFGGLKGILDVYGISVDRSLDSFRAETVSQDGEHAVVRVHFTFLGAESTSDVDVVKTGSDWLPEEKAPALAGG
jgi:hypothetical protein